MDDRVESLTYVDNQNKHRGNETNLFISEDRWLSISLSIATRRKKLDVSTDENSLSTEKEKSRLNNQVSVIESSDIPF